MKTLANKFREIITNKPKENTHREKTAPAELNIF